ncbi:hypothetical protein C8Q79DRAFT_141671 [Trametes meyenii]|nr:hypothetical protein C8Q79DRAFT_141671 [Trametes meyenii]
MINIDKPKKTDEDERLLNMLPHVEAGFTAAVQEAKSHYVHLTCKRVLDDLQEWAHGNSSEEQFCKPIWILSGPAGSGKSTIAFKFAKQQQDLKVLGASFFFNAAEEELSSVRRLFSTIAYQLAYAQPCFRPGIVNAIRAHLTAGTNQQIECDAENLILSPLRSLPQQAHSILIVVDGLDECTDDNSKVAFPKVLRLLVALTQVPGSPFQILITTRQRDDIDQALSAPELQAVGYHVPLLDHLQSTGVDDARACLRDRISGLVYFQKNAPALRNLVSHVAPSIAYARVAIEFLVDDLDHLTEGLETLQSSNASPPSSALCGLYLTIIGRTYRIGATQWERMRKRAERPVVFALCGSRVCYQRITDWLFSGALTMPHSSIPPSLTFQLCPKCSAIVASRPVELWMLKRITASLAQAGIGNGAIFPTMSEYSASPRDPWLPDPPPISSSQASEADWGRTWSMSHDEVTHPLPDSPALSAPTTPSPRPHDILPTGNLKTVDHKFPASAPSSKRTIGISTIGIRRVASSASMLSPRPSPFEQPEPGADASADLSVSKARGDKTSGVQPSVPVQHPYIRARSASGPDRPQPVVLASGGRNESRSYANVSGLCLKPLPATPPVRPATRPQLPV